MTTHAFTKTHNLIAYLAKPTESEGFEQIINFLNGSSVRYAFTASPTIRTSCIKQYWSTAKVKTVNDEVRVQDLFDGKQDIYDNPLLTKKVFANMKRVGTGFSRVITPLFESMLVQATEEVGEAQDYISILIASSTSKPHKKYKSKNQQPIAPKVPSPAPSPQHTIPSPTNDPIPDANKDSLKFQEFMDLCTRLSNKEENKILKETSFKSAKVDTATPVEDKEESFKQGRMIAKMDKDVEVNLQEAQDMAYNLDLQHLNKVLSMQDTDEEEPAEVEEVLKVVKAAKLMTK
nr:hypothetical protein [Tanacetum cinerariifolium]